MNEKANRYFALAAKYRQQGRTQMADALERQAQREMDRGAEDINDIIKENEQTATNPMRPVAPQTTQPAQQTVYQQPTPKYNPTTPAAPPASPVPYKPTEEELANMYDEPVGGGNGVYYDPNATESGSDLGENAVQVNEANGGNEAGYSMYSPNGMIKPIPANNREFGIGQFQGEGGSFDSPAIASSQKIYDPNYFAGAPAEGDSVWDTPEEQSARILQNRDIQDLVELKKKSRQNAAIQARMDELMGREKRWGF